MKFQNPSMHVSNGWTDVWTTRNQYALVNSRSWGHNYFMTKSLQNVAELGLDGKIYCQNNQVIANYEN